MRLVLKILAAVAVLLAVLGGLGYGFLLMNAERPVHPVGLQEVQIPDPQDVPVNAAIWYPTDVPGSPAIVGLSAQRVARDAAVVGRHLPLIVISHGTAGLAYSHADTALALASAGYVVVAVTHTGDNSGDQSAVGTARWLTGRARHIHLALDYMVNKWASRAQLDPARIGMFGFSAGGTTALIAIGGVPDLDRLKAHCRAHPEFACTLWKGSAAVPASAWVHDMRIKAAVIAAPGYGFAFEPDGLRNVTAKVQLWNGSLDDSVPYATNEAVVRRLLPQPPDYHRVENAGHFSFLPPCAGFLMICRDAKGFDRAAFHKRFNAAVIAFFGRTIPAQRQ